MENKWDGDIDKTRESENETAKDDGYSGNKEYSNGTYGQAEYTVRERADGSGLSDVYIKSDSEKGHSHDVIDEKGNLIATYHDFLVEYILTLKELKELNAQKKSDEELKRIILKK